MSGFLALGWFFFLVATLSAMLQAEFKLALIFFVLSGIFYEIFGWVQP